ncbi:hypothetical protein IWQ55_001349 [Labrenzia sp. EL_208]|nr:hypothetical protein [Labrenzia sp. EL_132]MBG6228151.1 hypothetical protein [Labrenzia sp. EL_208]
MKKTYAQPPCNATFATAAGLALGAWVGPAVADYNFVGCTRVQEQTVLEAYAPTFARAKAAEDRVGPTAIYTTWFGEWSPERGELVFSQIRDIIAATLIGTPQFTCLEQKHIGCKTGARLAFIFRETSYDIFLCPLFFEIDGSEGVDRTSVLIHELAHFEIGVAGMTGDHCAFNDAAECKSLARDNPDLAVRNADNFRLFIEQAAHEEFGVPLPFSDWPRTLSPGN